MKNLGVFGLALAGILFVLYVGANGLSGNYSWGPFFIFVGACSTIGLTIDSFFLHQRCGIVFNCHKRMTKNNFTEIVGLAAGICTAVSLLPQIIKIIKEKAAQDISLFYLLVLLFGLGLWTYYGFLKKDVPIIATNIFSMILNIVVIVLGAVYGKKRKDPT